MSNCQNNSLSCGRWGAWPACRPWDCGASCTCNSCSNQCSSACILSDNTPACNPCAPWGTGCGCSRCSLNSGCNANCPCSANCAATCGGCNNCINAGTGGYLVPRYVSIGRTFQRRITQTLCINDIPDCAESPLTLVSVTVSGQASWEQISECRQQLLRVTVPVVVQIRDCAGRCRTGHAAVTLTIPLCGCSSHDFWRGQLYVAPCIRLAAPVTENEDGCFDATLEVSAEVYLVRLQAFHSN